MNEPRDYVPREPNPEKIAVVEEIRDKLSSSEVSVLVNFEGLNVSEINNLRSRLRKADVEFKVSKNTLIKVALESIGVKGIDEYMLGPTGIAFGKDPGAPVKVLLDFIEEFEKLQIKAAILGNTVVPPDRVQELTKMPSKQELIAMFVGGLNAPIVNLVSVLNTINPASGMVNVLQGTINKVVYVLQAIVDKQEKSE